MIDRDVVLAVCRRGDIAGHLSSKPESDVLGFCPECGAEIIWRCANCAAPIVGRAHGFDFPATFPTRYYLSGDFCANCGQPFSWASRKSMANHIENQLSRQPNLGEGDRRKLQAMLKVLRDEPSDREVEKMQVRALKALQEIAPKAWDAVAPVVSALATTWIKNELKMPPG